MAPLPSISISSFWLTQWQPAPLTASEAPSGAKRQNTGESTAHAAKTQVHSNKPPLQLLAKSISLHTRWRFWCPVFPREWLKQADGRGAEGHFFFFQTLLLLRAVPFPPPFPFGRRVRPLPCEMMFQICDQTCVTRYDVVNVHATTVSEGQRSIKLTHSHHSDTSTDSYTKTSRHSRISNKGTE